MIEVLGKKTQLCLIVYYTYGFEKISKPFMSFSQQSLEILKETNSKNTLPTDTLPDIFFKLYFWKFKLFHRNVRYSHSLKNSFSS
jgi:hypothetical protein